MPAKRRTYSSLLLSGVHVHVSGSCVFARVCTMCVFFFFCMREYMHVHMRHQAVLIYSNELGRITRGWDEGRRWCVFRGGTFFCWGSSLHFSLFPPRLFFWHLQMRLFARLRRRKAREIKKRKKKKLGDGERWGCKADRMPADKNIQCQGDTSTSKMAAAGGVLCGTNLETHCSLLHSGWHTKILFWLSTVFRKHNEANEIWTAH